MTSSPDHWPFKDKLDDLFASWPVGMQAGVAGDGLGAVRWGVPLWVVGAACLDFKLVYKV